MVTVIVCYRYLSRSLTLLINSFRFECSSNANKALPMKKKLFHFVKYLFFGFLHFDFVIDKSKNRLQRVYRCFICHATYVLSLITFYVIDKHFHTMYYTIFIDIILLLKHADKHTNICYNLKRFFRLPHLLYIQ